jgi:hypothetical protein
MVKQSRCVHVKYVPFGASAAALATRTVANLVVLSFEFIVEVMI